MDYTAEHGRFYTFVETQNGTSATDIHQKLLLVYPDAACSYSTVKRWCREFKNGQRVSFSDADRSGRPRSSFTPDNKTAIKELVSNDPRLSCRSLSDSLGISKDTVLKILTEELKMRKLCSIWVPHALTEANKQQRVESARIILCAINQLGNQVVRLYAVEDESWFNFHPTLPKQENKCWVDKTNGDSRQSRMTPKPTLTALKTLLIVCFTANGKIYIEATTKGETINSTRYVEFVRSLGDHWRRLRSDPTNLSELCFQHDNARPHTSAETTAFMTYRKVNKVYQSPYSPDFNMCDRWLFATLKNKLKKSSFNSSEEVKHAALQAFHSIPEERFLHEIDKLKEHLNAVIFMNGDYIV